MNASIPELIESAGHDFKVPSRLLASVIAQESGFNPKAVSKTGAQGLGQLEPETAKSLGVSDPFDVRQNVAGAALYLRQQLDRFKNNPVLALIAYNAGPERAAAFAAGNHFLPDETKNYVQTVMGTFEGGR